MRLDRSLRLYKAGAMALTSGLLAATAWGQPPAAPAPAPASAPAPAPALAPAAAVVPASVDVPGVYCAPGFGGRIGGAVRHAGHALQDGVIGYPQYFDEPPVGYYLNLSYHAMTARANPHRFTVYRTDFLPGTTALSPTGATRFNLMASRLPRWAGPVVIEWSPDEPGLAEARRTAVVGLFQRARLPVVPERVVIGPSPYPGGLGADASNTYNTMISRDMRAGMSYSTTPGSASGFGAGGSAGGGGGGQP